MSRSPRRRIGVHGGRTLGKQKAYVLRMTLGGKSRIDEALDWKGIMIEWTGFAGFDELQTAARKLERPL